MTALVRSAGLSGFEDLAGSLGVDVAKATRRARIPLKALRDPDGLLSYAAVIQLLEQTAEDARCPDFAMRLAQRQGIDILGPIALVMQHARTILEAMHLGATYAFVQSPALRFSVVPVVGNSQLTDLCVAIDMPVPKARRQAYEHALCVVIKFLVQLSEGRARPELVLFPHAQWAPAPIYAEAFGCPCHFDQTYAAIRVATGALSRALPLHNPMLLEMARSYLDSRFTQPNLALSVKVHELIRQFLGTEHATQENIAATLGIHPRTLQRRLAEEGNSFDSIKDEVRRSLLEQLMKRPKPLPLSQVAAMLGYAEQSALTRSCRRWFGVAPSQMR